MSERTVASFSDGDVQVWPDILESMYYTGGTLLYSAHNEVDGESRERNLLIYDQFDVSQTDVQTAVGLLKRAELVEMDTEPLKEREITYLKLTKRGFEVAHEREIAKEEQETNDNLAFFTLVLGFAAIVQGIAAALQLDDPSYQLGLLLILFLVTLMIAFYQSDPLKRFRALFDSLWS